MIYHLNSELKKIASPVVIRVGEKVLHFSSGTELVEYEFDKPYRVLSMKAADGIIELELEEKERIGTNWIGEEQVSFF